MAEGGDGNELVVTGAGVWGVTTQAANTIPYEEQCSEEIDPSLLIVYWISLGVFALSTLVALGVWWWRYRCSKFARAQDRYKKCDDAARCYDVRPVTTCDSTPLPQVECPPVQYVAPDQETVLLEPKCSMFTFDAITYATLVFFLNTVLYAVLLMGQGVVYRYDISLCIPWVRWAVYAVSCSMLAYKIALFQRMVSSVRVVFVGMITATMLFGLFSVLSVHVETNRWIWFGIGFAPYFIAILVLFVFIDPCNYLASQGGVYLLYRIPVFVLLFWSLYPLPFALGPTLAYTISPAGEAWFYLALDLFTKVFFGFYLAFLEAKY